MAELLELIGAGFGGLSTCAMGTEMVLAGKKMYEAIQSASNLETILGLGVLTALSTAGTIVGGYATIQATKMVLGKY